MRYKGIVEQIVKIFLSAAHLQLFFENDGHMRLTLGTVLTGWVPLVCWKELVGEKRLLVLYMCRPSCCFLTFLCRNLADNQI